MPMYLTLGISLGDAENPYQNIAKSQMCEWKKSKGPAVERGLGEPNRDFF